MLSDLQVAAALIEHNAPLTATTKKGFSALHLAAKYGNLKVREENKEIQGTGITCVKYFVLIFAARTDTNVSVYIKLSCFCSGGQSTTLAWCFSRPGW